MPGFLWSDWSINVFFSLKNNILDPKNLDIPILLGYLSKYERNRANEGNTIMKNLVLCVVLGVFAFFAATNAVVRSVTADGFGDHASIQEAFAACQDYDTILIAAAFYDEPEVVLANKSHVVVSGTGFNDQPTTTLNGKLTLSDLDSCEVWSLYIANGVEMQNCLNTEVRRCYVTGNLGAEHSFAVVSVDTACRGTVLYDNILAEYLSALTESHLALLLGGSGEVNGCIITQLLTYYNSKQIDFRTPGSLEWQFTNCVFASLNQIFQEVRTNPVQIRNCIIWGVNSVGATWGLQEWSYNASNLVLPGTNNVTLTQNPFVSYVHANPLSSDFQLAGIDNLCWDAGDPTIRDRYDRGHDPFYSDIGCFGGMTPFVPNGHSPFPVLTTVAVSPVITVGDSLFIRSTARIAPRY